MVTIDVLASTISDNFFYLVHNGDECLLIDPVDADVAAAAIDERALKLTALVNTHWHPDHVGGNSSIMQAFPGCEVIMPRDEAAQIESVSGVAATRTVTGGDSLLLLGDVRVDVHDVPGHTMGHVAYEIAGEHWMQGDVIFGVGVGHCKLGGDEGVLFQTVRHMVEHVSMDAKLYPGHNYALRNAGFALQFEPENAALLAHIERLKTEEDRTISITTLGEECAYNPFLRTTHEGLQEALQKHDQGAMWSEQQADGRSDSEVAFRVLRALRDTY